FHCRRGDYSDHRCAHDAGVHGADDCALPAGHRGRGAGGAGKTEARRGALWRRCGVRFWSRARFATGRSRGRGMAVGLFASLAGLAGLLASCALGSSNAEKPAPAAIAAAAAQSAPPVATAAADAAPPAAQTGGFDGAQAFEYLARQVAFGPRPAGSPALARTQDYIKGQLASFGCAVDEDNFTAQTPIGPIRMKNILAKVPGSGREIILLLTHYDTVRIANFVGANDAASSTAVMLE